MSLLEQSACSSKSGPMRKQEGDRRGRRSQANLIVPTGPAISLFPACPRSRHRKERGERRQREEGGGKVWQQQQQTRKSSAQVNCGDGSRPWQVGHMRLRGSSLPGLTPLSRPSGSSGFSHPWPLAWAWPAPLPTTLPRCLQGSVLVAGREVQQRTWEKLC